MLFWMGGVWHPLIRSLHNLYLSLLSRPVQGVPDKLKCTYKDFIVRSVVERKKGEHRLYWQEEMEEYRRLDIFSQEAEAGRLLKTYDAGYLDRVRQRGEAR